MATATEPTFDKRAFGHYGRQPVEAIQNRDGSWQNSLDWGDHFRGHVELHNPPGSFRRLAPPAWAFDRAKLAVVVVHLIERRAGIKKPEPGSPQQRLETAMQVLKGQRGHMVAVLDKMCAEYVCCEEGARKKALAVEIEGLDTQLCHLDRNLPGLVLRVLYLYWALN